MALYNFKEVNGKKIIEWNKGRLRGVEKAKDRIGDISKVAKELLKNKKKIRILEIGCGYGRALVELKKIFGDKVETHGINLEPRWKVNLVKKFNLANNVAKKEEIDTFLPKVHIMDVGKKLKFPSNSFDLIFSQSTYQYVHDKAKSLEEVNRILTKKGIALIHMQGIKAEHYPVEYRNLFEIWKNGKRVDYRTYLKKFKNIVFKKSKDEPFGFIVMKKTKQLKLNLKYISSFDLNKIHSTWWGSKVIYKVK